VPTILFAITASPIWTMKDGRMLPAGFWAEEVVDPQQADWLRRDTADPYQVGGAFASYGLRPWEVVRVNTAPISAADQGKDKIKE
jgi:hypothetical protein